MSTFIIYLFEVSICFALFYLVYIAFKGDTFYYLKRFYLIFTVFISLIIPQLTISALPAHFEQLIAAEPTQNFSNITFHDTFEKVVFGQIPENILTTENNYFHFLTLLGIIYLIGALYFVYRLLKNIFHIHHLYRHNEKENDGKFKIVLLPDEYPTFSFFNFIFLNKKNLSEQDTNDVILHEIVHVKQKHSIDIMFLEICRIVFWFNPVIWFYKSSIVKVHECLADQYFVENKPNNIIDYQSLLLKQYLSKIHIELAHPFNYSLIKYRIKMMTKNKSKWWAKYKLVLALPIVIISLVAFSNADINLDDTIGANGEKTGSKPEGMVLIPQGSIVVNREVAENVSKLNVSVSAFWMKETEVSVKEYFEFLNSIKKKASPEEYKLLLPDYSKAPFKGYFTRKKYQNYPVVGVNYKQAHLYCTWKTNEELIRNGNQATHDYRLPTEHEWLYASLGGVQPDDIERPEITPLSKIESGKPNDWGLFNIFDNVSEWTGTSFFMEEPKFINQDSVTYDIILPPGEEKRTVKRDHNSNFGHNIGVNFVTTSEYLQSNSEISERIVKGNNYKNLIPDETKNLNSQQSYDYVGFRYVCSYIGDAE